MELFEQLLVNSFISAGTYVLITLGFNLIYGTTKFVNMAHGAIAASGAYIVFSFARVSGVPVTLSVILGIAGAGLLGWMCDRLIFSVLRKKHASDKVLFVASLGIFIILQSLFAMLFGVEFNALLPSSQSIPTYQLGNASITLTQIIIILAAAIAYFGLLLLLNYTLFGKAVKAIQDDEEVARVLGINTDRIVGWIFFLGSAIAGIGGILVGFDIGIYPAASLNMLVEGAASSIIGGIGVLGGGVVGSFILGFAENFGIWKITSEWKPAITFVILMLFLIFKPHGIFKK